MADIQAPWVGGEYEPMLNTDEPWTHCDYCGRAIYAGEKYLDAGEIMCEECLSEHIRKAG